MKKGSYPPFRKDLTSYYKCVYLNQIDDENFEWINVNNKCLFTFENEFFIRCSCNGLSQFTVLRGVVEYLPDIPDIATITFYS